MIKNSEAKTLEPGTARAAIPKIIETVASTGRRRARPPSFANEPLPTWVSSQPTTRNSAAETSAWLTIWNVAPVAPRSDKRKMPSTMKDIWAIDEYATTPRPSRWRKASSEPHRKPIVPSAINTQAYFADCAGKSGTSTARNAKAPAFEATPLSMAATSGEAWR